MREPTRGAFGRATAVAEGVAAAVRRRQRDREPRVLLYRRAGDPRVLAPGAKGHDEILELSERMIALVDEEQRGQPTRSGPSSGRAGRPRRREAEDT
ncbi:MAG: hypothetical protein M3356_05770 [Actinomycetota bacterium]|nr:hypothetical protein [Actinomycetota bacterium]